MALSGNIAFSLGINIPGTLGLNTNANLGLPSYQVTFPIGDGTGAGQGNKLHTSVRTFSTANDDLDLAGGITDNLGVTLTFARVIAVMVRNRSASNGITVGGSPTNAWTAMLGAGATASLAAAPGGAATGTGTSAILLFNPSAAGWAVTAGTGDIFRITGTVGQSYDLVILGS